MHQQDGCCRPEYSWSTNQIKAYWVSFKTAEERRRALEMNNRFLVSGLVSTTQAVTVQRRCERELMCIPALCLV